MPKSVEFCQLIARAISHTTWNIPRIRDGDQSFTSSRDNNFTRRLKLSVNYFLKKHREAFASPLNAAQLDHPDSNRPLAAVETQ